MSTPALPVFNSTLFNAALFGGSPSSSGRVVQAGSGLLYPALRKAAITLGPQRTPSPAQFQDAIDELARLTGSLNCDRLFIYSLDILALPLTAGKKTYTIGQDPTGVMTADWNAPRPQGITEANVISNEIRYPVAVLTPQTWAAITLQDVAGTIPEAIYNDRAYPLSTIYVYGQAMANTTLELYAWHQIPTFTALTDVVLLPPGYEDALVLNLAVRLAPHFQRIIPDDVRQQARESLMRLESLNAPQPIASVGFGCCGDGFNIYQG
jgi:hypothetical protein